MVLQSQVETMISRFGCSENLHHIVGQLWLQFLKKYYEYVYKDNDKSDEVSQVIVDDEDENKEKDEQESIGQSDPVNENSAPENTNNNNNGIDEGAVQPNISSDPLNNTNVTDKSNVEPNDQQNGENKAGEAAPNTEENAKVPSIKAFLSRKKPKFSLSVCFIYLGCLWCREPLDISDIMRWMRSGELPFVSVVNSLPRNIDKISFLKSLVRSYNGYYCIVTNTLVAIFSHQPVLDRHLEEVSDIFRLQTTPY